MAQQNLILNLINFFPEETKKTFSFTKAKKDGYVPFTKSDFPKNITDFISEEELGTIETLYTDFSINPEEELCFEIDIYESKKLAKHYYNSLINNYFASKGFITNSNFVHDTEVWVEYEEESDKDFTAYKVYVLKVQIARQTKEPELVLSFDGVTKLFKKNVQELDFDTTVYNWCKYKNHVYKYEERPEEARYNDNLVYPKLNYELKKAMGLPFESKRIKNKYKNYFNHICDFYGSYMNTKEFRKVIPISTNGFYAFPESKVKHTSLGSNKLVFGGYEKNINPYFGIQNGGPLSLPKGNHFKFIYVFHEADKGIVNELKLWFKGEKEGFEGIKKYVRLTYSGDNDNSIMFTNIDNAITEVREQIAQKNFDDNVRYIAIYLSPISKEDPDEEKHAVYYLLKEELLKYRITSQFIERETLYEEGFTTSLKNISIAIVAKLNGIPWLLERKTKSDLIVGVGAFKNTSFQQTFIASTCCFANDGQFKEINCCSEEDSFKLAGRIYTAIRDYKKENENIERLVIHFYKEMSEEELIPIKKTLYDLDLDIPVFIVTVNKTESREYVVFDNNFSGKIPISGTFVSIGWNQFLLCNNTRYLNSIEDKIDSFPFPVRIKISCTKKELLKDFSTTKALVDQVYQFSRMYWKSLRQQNIPVTIKYAEMVAQVYPYFENKEIPPFGKSNPWFL